MSFMWRGNAISGDTLLIDGSREDFVKLMGELNLAKSWLIDVAVPANQKLGLPQAS